MRNDESSESNIPAFLKDTLTTVEFHRRAGEWDLIIPATILSGFPHNLRWIEVLVGQFLSAFPWINFHEIELGIEHNRKIRWDQKSNALELWLEALKGKAAVPFGLEASLDLFLMLPRPDQATGKSLLPKTARLLVDKTTLSFITCTLTIWPNLFTDNIYIYHRKSGSLFDRQLVSFRHAAQANRRTLASSLRAWESLTGGEITSWESEFVDGISRYGFHDDSNPV